MRIFVILLLGLLFIPFTGVELYSKNKSSSLLLSEIESFSEEEKGLWNSLFYTYKLIKKSSIFTDNTSATNLIMSAIKGMVNSLDDPYSILLQGKSLEQFIQSLDNHYSGIGIYIVTNELGIKIVDVIPNSPAWVIGLSANDIITAVEGKPVAGISIEETRALLLGKEGSLVNITILRAGKELSFNVIRKDIQVKTVYSSRVGQKRFGYIRVINFGQTTVSEFEETLVKLKSQRIQGLVIDLRNNPGGLLSAVARMVDFFIPNGMVVSTQKAGVGTARDKLEVRPLVLFPTFIPVVVLINKYSASASEIFAGAMRDHRRAVLVGENSYGKFSVQQLFPVYQDPKGENNAVLKLTIAKYFLPKGDSYEQVGIKPHILIEQSEGENTNSAYGIPSPHSPPPEDEPHLVTAFEVLANAKLYHEYLKKP